jgi:hypothetical protein
MDKIISSNITARHTLDYLDLSLSKHGWKKNVCDSCSETFYSMVNTTNCGSDACTKPYSYIRDENHNTSISSVELNEKLKMLFAGYGYEKTKPRHILHTKSKPNVKILEESLFTIAGVQILDSLLFDEQSPVTSEQRLFVSQPSVRLNFIQKVGTEYGLYSSFVNVCTLSTDATPESFVNEIQLWGEVLGNVLGLNLLSIKISEKISNWAGKQSPVVKVLFSNRGLELGDGCFHYSFPQTSRPNLQMTDIGFGLERLTCAINGTNRHFDVMGPYLNSIMGDWISMDRLRTLVLLVGSNVLPSESHYGTKVRGLIKDLDEADNSSSKWINILPYYYSFWSNFTTLELTPMKIRDLIRDEIFRSTNIKLANILRLSISQEQIKLPPFEFVENLIKGSNKEKLSIAKVENALTNLHRNDKH